MENNFIAKYLKYKNKYSELLGGAGVGKGVRYGKGKGKGKGKDKGKGKGKDKGKGKGKGKGKVMTNYEYRKEIPIPENKVGLLIGEKGTTINSLKHKYRNLGARIDLTTKIGEDGMLLIHFNDKAILDQLETEIEPLIRVRTEWNRDYFPSSHPIIKSEILVDGNPLKIISWNCDLAGHESKHPSYKSIYTEFYQIVIENIVTLIRLEVPDIILLQEFKVTNGGRIETIQGYSLISSNLPNVVTLVKNGIALIPRNIKSSDSVAKREKLLPLIFYEGEYATYKDTSPSGEGLLKLKIDKLDILSCQFPIKFQNKQNVDTRLPPVTIYKDKSGEYKIGKNTSLDIIIKFGDRLIRIRNIHFDVNNNKVNKNFFQKLEGELLIIGGDFNSRSLSEDWRPIFGDVTSDEIGAYHYTGKWNDGFIIDNSMDIIKGEYYPNTHHLLFRKNRENLDDINRIGYPKFITYGE